MAPGQARSQDFSLGGVWGLKNCRYHFPHGVESGEGLCPLPIKFLEFYHCTDYILEHSELIFKAGNDPS